MKKAIVKVVPATSSISDTPMCWKQLLMIIYFGIMVGGLGLNWTKYRIRMIKLFKTKLVLFLVLMSFAAKSQKLNIGWKRMGDVTLYLHEGNRYDYNPLQLFNFHLEKPLKSPHFSLGIDISYGNYTPKLPPLYNQFGDHKKFHDRSFGLGGYFRYYSRPKIMRLFVEGGLQWNYLKLYQPILIPHDFGIYQRIIDSEHYFVSTTVAVGFSLGSKSLRWEPYVQFGVGFDVEDVRAGRYALSSIGIANSGISIFITPLALKYMFH